MLRERAARRRPWAHQMGGASAAFVASHLAAGGEGGGRPENWERGREAGLWRVGLSARQDALVGPPSRWHSRAVGAAHARQRGWPCEQALGLGPLRTCFLLEKSRFLFVFIQK